jgi:hypothetical protein
MGGEIVSLLRRLLDLRLRWRLWVGFIFDFMVGVAWHWINDLWYWWRVCYLQN